MLLEKDRIGQVIRKIPYKGYFQTQIDYIHLCKDCGTKLYKTKREELHSLGRCNTCARKHLRSTTCKFNEKGEKLCNTCLRFLPIENFNKSKLNKNRYSTCSRCSVLKRFEITAIEYETLFKEQNSACAICKQPPSDLLKGKIKYLSVDHNHTTGVVRGLLCQKCNQGLGMFKDNIENFKEAIKYLEHYK